jgi:hypothetical protein
VQIRRLIGPLAATVAISGAVTGAVLAPLPAQAYSPTSQTIYQLPGDQACLKGRGNCAIYPKAAQLGSGRLVASFELSTVPASGSAAGQTLPVYSSDDDGDSWQLLSQVQAPAYLSSDPAVAKYTSAWTNPYLYVLPEKVGDLAAGTLVMAAVVSGDDYYYTEHKAADPSWTPSNDGDRKDMAIALYASADQGATWSFQNIITTGGWEGGSAGAIGTNVATANTYGEVDPVWEPYLMTYDGKLVAYFSDEDDYTGYDPTTGVLTLDPDNETAADSGGQVLAHRTWDGTSAAWTPAVVDVSGTTVSMGGGKSEIGGGRPGMANVVQTSDGTWMLTYEYWGGGSNIRYKIASDPLTFFADGDPAGQQITGLPVSSGSKTLTTGGSPVLVRTPDGRLLYNAAGSGDVWMNASGSSTGTWTEYQTTLGAGYSRNLTYDATTGQVVILANKGTSTIVTAEVDLGHSAGTYYQLVNRLTGQVIGTGDNTTDADIGNDDVPDVRLEDAGAAADADTTYWHLVTKPDGAATLLNKSAGRAAAIWTGNATAGQRIGQWVDDTTAGLWNVVTTTDGYTELQSAANPSLYLTGASTGSPLTLATAATDGSQDWTLVPEVTTPPADQDLTPGTPQVSGRPVVGSTLTAAPGTWGPAPVTLSYQWLRSGVAVPGATGTTYPVTAADLGATLSVRVTGAKTGYTTVAKVSVATAAVAAGALSAHKPKIKGKARVGKKLKAKAGAWGPVPVTLSYQWYRNGKPIKGATRAAYKLKHVDRRKKLTVKVTATKPGYTTLTQTSKATTKVR